MTETSSPLPLIPGGWIKLHRVLAYHELWLREKFTKGQAFTDLIMLANYKTGVIRRRGIKITVKRGQVGYSYDELARRWRWSKGKVIRFLNELKLDERIVLETELKNIAVSTLITITNYEQYQGNGNEDDTEDDTEERTVNGTRSRRVKEVKNKISSSEACRLSELLADLILQNNPGNTKLNNGKREATVSRWAADIDKLIRLDGQGVQEIEGVILWCQADDFWKSNILSGGKLRKQYDQLAVKKSIGTGGQDKPDASMGFYR
jgi:hypothetical protein